MPKFKVYQLFTREVKITLVNGDELTLTYTPASLSTKLYNEATGENPTVSDSEFIAKVTTMWDWLDEKGKRIPISPEFLETEVFAVDRAGMVRAILRDTNPTQPGAEAAEDAG